MGWTVLYIAFGVVALWLLGEVLLQYKARLRWRLLAFGGFVGVVVGVLIPSVVVIGLGAAAFAVGQTYVTLSFRRGFAEGWAVSRPGAAGETAPRRRGRGERKDPTLEVSGLEAADAGHDLDADPVFAADPAATAVTPAYGRGGDAYDDEFDRDDVFTPAARTADPASTGPSAVYEPQPLPDDTGSYGVYSDSAYAAAGQPQDQYATAAQGADQGYGYDGYSGYGQQQYGYDTSGGQQQYAAYSDPYIGTQTYGGGGGYDGGYDQQYNQQQGYGQDQYGNGGYDGTPPGGVWVPQQRTDDAGGDLPPEQPYPYQGGQSDGRGQQHGDGGNSGNGGNGYDEQQYRF
ncbi:MULTISPECIES: hypothetical protein [unclassified Streptomyces]|uniref:SCO2102 family sporulation regulator n=1 Tax=unclassified Streptomyces TaxID=2593676 RepID=UPI0037F59612